MLRLKPNKRGSGPRVGWSGLWLAGPIGGDFGGDVAEGKLAGEVCSGQGGGVEEGVIDDKDGSAVFIGTVEIGDGSGGEVS